MRGIRFQVHVLLSMMLLLAGTLAYGQADRATITGTVTDTSGAVVPNATVTATDLSTQSVFTTTTNGNGVYSIPSLPIHVYMLEVTHPGFLKYQLTGVSPLATQVMQVNAKLKIGSPTETVTVTGGVPLLQTQTSNEATTMEQKAIQELPLNAKGGRSATQLILATSPNIGNGYFWEDDNTAFISIAGGLQVSNSAFIDGVDATDGYQGSPSSPGMDALSEMQVQTVVTDAQLSATGGGALLYELKSGTNHFHGSAFEFLQNEDLNANSWSDNQWLSTCGGNAGCRATYSRPVDRFNDYGGSAGGPIWKNRSFIFGDYERYRQSDWSITPNGETVPTAAMLNGDFSDLLTGGSWGTNSGPVIIGGATQINPCTGQPYQYGQIMDPSTAQTVNGVMCSSPFPGNIIPASRLSSVSQKIAQAFNQYYKPTINRLIDGNYPVVTAGQPQYTRTNVDIKFDQNFSQKQHLSASVDLMFDDALRNYGPFGPPMAAGPFSSVANWGYRAYNSRIIDTYVISPTLINTGAFGFILQENPQKANSLTDVSSFGLPPGTVFPAIDFEGGSVNGISTTDIGLSQDVSQDFDAYHYQDTVSWQKGSNSFSFGGEWAAQLLNGGDDTMGEQEYNFQSDTGGPVNPALTPYVGNAVANLMLGYVNYGTLFSPNVYHPRQKTLSLFAQDDIKVNPKLTLNLGIGMTDTFAGHVKGGQWQNFDLTQTNPNWAPHTGAWEFAGNSSTTFERNNYVKFGPHIGGAYRVTNNLVARASYGVFYVPLGAMSSGSGDLYAATQDPLSIVSNQEITNVPGSYVYNWSNGYPGTPVTQVQNSTATTFGDADDDSGLMQYIAPDMRNLGHVQTFYAGVQYEVAPKIVLDLRYVGDRGGNLHDYGHSIDQSWPLNFGQYQSLLEAGNIDAPVNNAGDADALGIQYPYPGFSGPAYAAIAPYPQLAQYGYVSETEGQFNKWAAVSAYNSFVAEVNVRSSHGLYADWNFTISKQTSNQSGFTAYANNWGSMFQSPTDSIGSSHWVTGNDQRYLLKGYLTYDLPFGKGRQWLNNSGLMNYAIGGWTLGYYGSYGSGLPMGAFYSTYSLPYYYSSAQRVFFANGANATNMKNHFDGHLNLINPLASSNNDFSPNNFVAGNATKPFGDTPYTWDHWRWNPGAAQENVSILKHFRVGPEGRYQLEVGSEFYNVFNRHYYSAPDSYIGDSTFGMVTGVSGSRIGQLRARFQW